MWHKKFSFNIRNILSHHRTPAFYRILPFWWYRFQNSATVWDIDLKFGMVIVLGKLEDRMCKSSQQGSSINYVNPQGNFFIFLKNSQQYLRLFDTWKNLQKLKTIVLNDFRIILRFSFFDIIYGRPLLEDLHAILQFSKHYYHTEFQANTRTVTEFWKRYHQNGKMRWKAGVLWGLKKFLMLKEIFLCHKHYTPWRASYEFWSKCGFSRQFQGF